MNGQCKPYISVANVAVAEVPTGGNVPLGSLVGKECCKYRLAGDGIVVRGGGESIVTGTVSMRPAAEASSGVSLSCELRRNGQPVQGGSSRIDSTGVVTLPVCATVTGDPCNTTTLTIANTGVDAAITGVSLVVRPI